MHDQHLNSRDTSLDSYERRRYPRERHRVASIILNSVDFRYDSPYNEGFTGLSLMMATTWCTGLISRNGQLVTHDQFFIEKVATAVVELLEIGQPGKGDGSNRG